MDTVPNPILPRRTFVDYYFSTFYKPRSVFESLLLDDRMVRFSFYAVSLNAFFYTLVYVNLIYGGGQAFKSWLAISPDEYYRWNVFFLAPSMFLGWILAAGVVHLLSKIFSGAGRFEETLGVFGFGIAIASYSTMIHDLLTSFLGAIHIINQREYEFLLNSPTLWRNILWFQFAVYFFWFVLLFSKGVSVSQKLPRGESIALGTVGFFTYQLFFAIFNR